MEFALNLKMFENDNFSHAFKVWMEKRKLDLEQGKVNMSSNLNFIIEGDEPFFIAFDEFHMKHIQNAPESFHGWKIFAIAASNLNGHLQIIHLKSMSSGIGKLGSVAIKDSVEEVLNLINNLRLKNKLAGAVADKCPSNQEAIAFLQQKQVPVLYDLHHFCGTILRLGHVDTILTHLYLDVSFSKHNYVSYITKFKRLVEDNVPQDLKDRYIDELLSLESFVRNVFQVYPDRSTILKWLNSNHFERVGALLVSKTHVRVEEGFQQNPC
ncbi:uncharacterized protein LOC116656604 [Drosophila ananassae]|uniref:uncharacterized protein LOC116656604 n=1 Tax=Drosophila ananassae TaxID=7217 RepID=UPI001D000803|nr:uncharacterized protein LOC116656604 [Drosophila ananassae]